MSDKPDNFDLPRSWMPAYEPPSRKGVKTFPEAKDIRASDVVEFNNINGPADPDQPQTGSAATKR